jgi:hypothetical protein
MLCSLNNNFNSIGDFLVFPNLCSPYFYLMIIGALWLVIGWTLYKVEKATVSGGGDLMSCLAISSIAMIVLSLYGTFITNSQNIPMITSGIFVIILAVGIPFILIWIFKD